MNKELNHYTLEINTIHGIADSDVLDRLAERVYELDDLIDPTLGLNDDGSITASFDVVGMDPLIASQRAVRAFLDAVGESQPLRLPTGVEESHGIGEAAQGAASALEGFAIAPTADREAALA
jgi:hypothetical protein